MVRLAFEDVRQATAADPLFTGDVDLQPGLRQRLDDGLIFQHGHGDAAGGRDNVKRLACGGDVGAKALLVDPFRETPALAPPP